METIELLGVLGPICLGIAIGVPVGKAVLYLINAIERVSQAWDARRATSRRRCESPLRRPRLAIRQTSTLGRAPAGV
ncbi:MAG TPA: hypothetical protein VHV55_21875 [Pirellulales bacterium]|jgi:hypothetical protein|nr:hypothetical protein [Pirellulales bacterium]